MSLDVKFNENDDKIIGMRFLIQAVNISGTEHEKEMVGTLREICRKSPLNVTVFHPYFVFFDQVNTTIKTRRKYFTCLIHLFQFELVRPLSIQNMIIGATTMMVISFIFIPNIFCSLWVAFSIISIEVGVIGYMALWGVNLDSISMINLIMCIGFSVDFTAHICYAYMSSKEKKPDNRVKECLYALGVPIFQGSISTILGMIALLLANNYIFSVFFKMVFLVVFFGAMHGLFLLPVLLSVFGPGSCTNFDEDEDDPMKLSPIQRSLPHPYCIPHPQFTLNGSQGSNVKNQKFSPLNKHMYKIYGESDKDLGLGTSEENSIESSSNRSNNSNKKKRSSEDEVTERMYKERWRRSSNSEFPQCEFRSSQLLDIYGNDSERDWYKQKERVEVNKRKFYESRMKENLQDWHNVQKHRRRYSPPEQSYHMPNQTLVRSNSYHNLQYPNFIKESRFP